VAAAVVLKDERKNGQKESVADRESGVPDDSCALDLASLRSWARQLLTAHKLPSRLLVLDELPRNAMGKIMKPAVTALFESQGDGDSIDMGTSWPTKQ
jgi:malonyl-CoA/methylmalonyl-CoA synthetase